MYADDTVLLGMTKRLKTACEINVLYNNQRINFTETYRYLGITWISVKTLKNHTKKQVVDYNYLNEWDAISYQKLHN